MFGRLLPKKADVFSLNSCTNSSAACEGACSSRLIHMHLCQSHSIYFLHVCIYLLSLPYPESCDNVMGLVIASSLISVQSNHCISCIYKLSCFTSCSDFQIILISQLLLDCSCAYLSLELNIFKCSCQIH